MLRSQKSEFMPSAPPLEVVKDKLSTFSIDSADNDPSAPPSEMPLFENLVTQLELTISASSLLNLDQFTRSDPLCVVFLQDSTTAGEWIELGRTEAIMNNLNPEWKTKFIVDYRFEERQMVTLMVFDKDCAKYSLENHDYLGSLECSLGEIASSPHSKLTKRLKLPSIHSTVKQESTLSVIAEEAGDSKKYITFVMKCFLSNAKLSSSSSIFKTEVSKKVYIDISKQLVDNSWILLHRTDRVMSQSENVIFAPVSIRYSSVCKKGNLEVPLRFQLHQIKQSFRGRSSKLLGEVVTNFIEISEKLAAEAYLQLYFPSTCNIKDGNLVIYNYKLESHKTFMDYIQDGLEINIAVGIDFTASNGEPTLHSSLHYKHGKRDNPYAMTLKIVGEILQDYSSSKQIYAYGFGAKGGSLSNRVNHKFPLNFKENNPTCQGIDGVLNAYYRALQKVKLSGPTCFAPIIREVTDLARRQINNSANQKYYVLLILTDGVVCDPDTTTDALVEASKFPMSVIIIGIGDENFSAMEKFDSDEKPLKSRANKYASRDIVQFVELQKFVDFKSILPLTQGSKIALTRSVLAELPQQVVTWMNSEIKE